MRTFCRLLMLLTLCLSLALPGAYAEQAVQEASPGGEGTLHHDAVLSEETILSPAYPVPEYVEWLLDTARTELGYTEERNGATKYGTWSGDPTAEWCAEFLCWCVDQVDKAQGTKLLTRTYPNYTGTNVGRNWFITQGRYVARSGFVPGWGSQWFKGQSAVMAPNSYIPQPGDWVFFSDNAAGDTSHVAMVEYCAQDAQGQVFVHVIEGNNPSQVARNTYPLNYWGILGYGTVHDVADTAMKTGNQGEKVTALQQLLAEAGLMEERYTTGKFGAITTQAVKDFQAMMGMEASGNATLPTQAALERYVEGLRQAAP